MEIVNKIKNKFSLFSFNYFDIQFGDENNNPYTSRWSVTELKERQTNISVFARIYEEYTDAEHFFDFTRKTASILFQTSKKKKLKY